MARQQKLRFDDRKARVKELAADPDAKVMVFVDGQNLYKRCQEFFGHALCYPHLLAETLAGPRRLVGTRFYTGEPDRYVSESEAVKQAQLRRRLGALQACGVTVITRELQYNWEWGFPREERNRLEKPGRNRADMKVWAESYQRPREKGIDLAIGLEVMEFAIKGLFDVAIIVSQDSDLHEIPQALKEVRDYLPGDATRVEAAVPVHPKQTKPIRFRAFDYTHPITKKIFDPLRDNTDYTVPADQWKRPADLPRTLADLQ